MNTRSEYEANLALQRMQELQRSLPTSWRVPSRVKRRRALRTESMFGLVFRKLLEWVL